jgi:hypothetical protein
MAMARLTTVIWEIISGNNTGAGGYPKLGGRKGDGPLSDLQERHSCIGQTSSLPLSLYYYYFIYFYKKNRGREPKRGHEAS